MIKLTIGVLCAVIVVGATLVIVDKRTTTDNNAPVKDDANSAGRTSSGNTIDLSNQGLTKAPQNIFDKRDTEKLDLSHNRLTGSLQAEIRHLQELTVLDLSHNQFTGVPAEIGQLKNLQTLDLSNNMLTGLPYELGNLSKLKLLDISGNEYSEQDLKIIKEKLPATTVVKTK